MTTPEFRKMIGRRMRDNDGFTYVYGKAKGGYTQRSTAATKRCIRADKRGTKREETKRMMEEQTMIGDLSERN